MASVKQHVGIFGPGQSGKTTLARHILNAMGEQGFDSVALDLNGEAWGKHTSVYQNEEQFWRDVWSSERLVVCVEEATETIARSKDLIPVFTRLRHRGHKLVVVGHSGTNLLPIMREQLHFLYLFRQSPDAAKIWADTFADERIFNACALGQYEFIRCENFGAKDGQHLIQKNKLTIGSK